MRFEIFSTCPIGKWGLRGGSEVLGAMDKGGLPFRLAVTGAGILARPFFVVYSFIALSVSIFVMYIAKIENKIIQKIVYWLPAILLTFLIPGLLSFVFNLSLENIVLHDWSKTYIYPITIFCIMSSMSLAQLKIVGLKPLLLFFIGSFTIAIVPAILVMPYFSGSEQMIDLYKGIIPIVGSWIGGSSSMLVLKEYVSVREDLFLSVLLLDNMIQNIVMILLFQIIRRTDYFNRKFNIGQSHEFKKNDSKIDTGSKNQSLSVLISIAVTTSVILLNFSFDNGFLYSFYPIIMQLINLRYFFNARFSF